MGLAEEVERRIRKDERDARQESLELEERLAWDRAYSTAPPAPRLPYEVQTSRDGLLKYKAACAGEWADAMLAERRKRFPGVK